MADLDTIDLVRDIDVDKYKYGFTTDIETEKAPKGLSEEIVAFISRKKGEPQWMLDWRLEAYRRWLVMEEPAWARVSYPKIDFQDLYYYAAPKSMATPRSLDEIDPKLLETYAKLGIPLKEQEILAGVRKQGEKSNLDEEGGEYASGKVAIDAVFDSVSVVTTFKDELKKAGVIFCSISEALREHPDLVRRYLGSVVPQGDNFYAALNSAVFSDGSFVYVPEGVRCPMELSTYFRINEKNTGQFERTLIVADKGAHVSYLEGCTAPTRDENQLHAAVVELVARSGYTGSAPFAGAEPGSGGAGPGGVVEQQIAFSFTKNLLGDGYAADDLAAGWQRTELPAGRRPGCLGHPDAARTLRAGSGHRRGALFPRWGRGGNRGFGPRPSDGGGRDAPSGGGRCLPLRQPPVPQVPQPRTRGLRDRQRLHTAHILSATDDVTSRCNVDVVDIYTTPTIFMMWPANDRPNTAAIRRFCIGRSGQAVGNALCRPSSRVTASQRSSS